MWLAADDRECGEISVSSWVCDPAVSWGPVGVGAWEPVGVGGWEESLAAEGEGTRS